MSEDLGVSALSIADQAFIVASMIERCPKTMMVRELFVNAVEAAVNTSTRHGRVEIGATNLNGVPKLRFWNTGRGLSGAELHAICDLASSLHKVTSLDQNFGMGAKVASLPSNKHGVRYRSCRAGQVSEVVICQRNGIYGRLRRAAPNGAMSEVLDITDYSGAVDEDWTEVVLLGNRPEQDTVSDPYLGNPSMPTGWVQTMLEERFFRLPPEVEVTLNREVTSDASIMEFRPIWGRSPSIRMETVKTRSGIVIYYGFASGRPDAESLGVLGPGYGGVVHKGEIYELLEGRRWTLESPQLGIPFAAKYCTVFIELPDNYPVRSEAYREFLRFQGGDQRKVTIIDFGRMISSHMPAWMVQAIRSFGPRAADYMADLERELQDLIVDLGIPPHISGVAVGFPGPISVVTSDEMSLLKDPDPSPSSSVPLNDNTTTPRGFAAPPEIIALSDEEQILERGLKERAARYFQASYQIFVNLQYPSLRRASQQLQKAFAGAASQETIEEAARHVVEWAAVRRISRATLFGLNKQSLGWPAEDAQRALSPETLSVVVDDLSDAMTDLRIRMIEILERMEGVLHPIVEHAQPVLSR